MHKVPEHLEYLDVCFTTEVESSNHLATLISSIGCYMLECEFLVTMYCD